MYNQTPLAPEMRIRESILPILADHHLPYIVPVIVYWVVSMSVQ